MAPKRTDNVDPYAPPPMYHDKSGRVLRVGLLATLIAAIGVGYFAWSASTPQQTAVVTPPAQQQLADNGYRALPEQIPQAQPVAPTPPVASPAPTPERRAARIRSSRSESAAPEESASPPVSDVPSTPAPLAPTASTPQMPDSTPPAAQG